MRTATMSCRLERRTTNMSQTSEAAVIEPRRGRPKGRKDGYPRKPDVRLNAVLTAIRAANEAGFDLSIGKSGEVVLTPKAKAPSDDDKESTQ
jgi:hypothetical protein